MTRITRLIDEEFPTQSRSVGRRAGLRTYNTSTTSKLLSMVVELLGTCSPLSIMIIGLILETI